MMKKERRRNDGRRDDMTGQSVYNDLSGRGKEKRCRARNDTGYREDRKR